MRHSPPDHRDRSSSPQGTLRTASERGTSAQPVARARLVLLVLSLGACAPARQQEPPRQRSAPRTKATLFGDPALVPTRAGERARTELALASTIREHLAEDPQLAVLRTHVTTPAGEPPQVVISLRGPSERAPEIQSRAETVARAVIGTPKTQVTVDLVAADPAQEPKYAHLRPFLIVALLALGASLGVTIDRLRQRSGRQRPPG